MCKWMAGHHDSDAVERDLARAKSLLIRLRAKIDKGGNRKAQAYGLALVHVADLLSGLLGLPASDALLARGVSLDNLNDTLGDLERSAACCRTFLDATSPTGEIADSLATACSILADLYRMRFHAMKASRRQKAEAADLANRLSHVVEVLVHSDGQVRQARMNSRSAAK